MENLIVAALILTGYILMVKIYRISSFNAHKFPNKLGSSKKWHPSDEEPFDISDDGFWLDEPSNMTAGDQTVVDIALCLYDLEQEASQELDNRKREHLCKQMKEECDHLVQAIMSINMLDPLEAETCNTVVSMKDFIKH
jgi:hypothetical protein